MTALGQRSFQLRADLACMFSDLCPPQTSHELELVGIGLKKRCLVPRLRVSPVHSGYANILFEQEVDQPFRVGTCSLFS